MGQQVLNAIFIGSIYALFAVGYTLVFGVLDILNLAHSAVFMLGAAVTYSLVVNHGHRSWSRACWASPHARSWVSSSSTSASGRCAAGSAPPIAALISTIGLALIIVAAVEQGRPGSLVRAGCGWTAPTRSRFPRRA